VRQSDRLHCPGPVINFGSYIPVDARAVSISLLLVDKCLTVCVSFLPVIPNPIFIVKVTSFPSQMSKQNSRKQQYKPMNILILVCNKNKNNKEDDDDDDDDDNNNNNNNSEADLTFSRKRPSIQPSSL
jgi:hypothetical protein